MIKASRNELRLRKKAQEQSKIRASEEFYTMKQWKLVKARFMKNRLAVVGLIMVVIVYILAISCRFLAPYDPVKSNPDLRYFPPQKIHLIHDGKFIGPFVYGIIEGYDPVTYIQIYEENRDEVNLIKWFIRGDSYKFMGFFPGDIHLFGVERGSIHLFGMDRIGRDLFSSCLVGAEVSSSVGFIGVAISFIIGLVLGGLSGYLGGWVDTIIQRITDFIISIPTLPLWMVLAAAVPPNWPVLRVYIIIVIILSFVGWTGLARTVRSKFLSLKNEEYVKAARIAGTPTIWIIMRHMVPMFTSHLIASITLSVPGMILGETSLSFLGIGLRRPTISWGVLLSDAQNIRNVAFYPWTMLPCIFIIFTVMGFNFLGDGLRDAADPNS
jgi:peptide/nickel transport system permease protein